jgi:hypothetical protein
VHYVRLYNDAEGHARFEDGEVSFTSQVFAPPAPPLDVSVALHATELLIVRFPAGWHDAVHPAPARQWMFVLSGHGETTADGEARGWGPGHVFLVEDTDLPGHGTTVFEEAVFAVVRF